MKCDSTLRKFVNQFTLIFGAMGALIFTLPNATAAVADSYIGRRIETDSEEYAKFGGFAFTDEKNRSLPSGGKAASQPEYLLGMILLTNPPDNSVFLLSEGHNDESGHVDWILVHDAVDVPNGLQLIGRPTEEQCVAKSYPSEAIFVAGKWVNRKSRSGGYAGGYAYPIKKAWRVDFMNKKLEAIPTAGIKCEDNRTDADF